LLFSNFAVELLTNYGRSYKDKREREGYGFKNRLGKVKSDQDRASRFVRNFDRRVEIEEIVMSHQHLGMPEFLSMVEYFSTKVWEPLVSEARRWARNTQRGISPLTCRQWTAIRRLQWLRDVFLERIENGITEANAGGFHPPYAPPYVRCYEYCRHLLEGMRRDLFLPLFKMAEGETVVDLAGKSIWSALREDIIEETCYIVRDSLPMPFDASMWCPRSLDLLEELCLLANPLAYTEPATLLIVQRDVLKGFQEAAVKARHDVLEASGTSVASSKLAFESGLRPYVGNVKGVRLTGTLQESLQITKSSSSFFFDNSVLPKGVKAAVIEKLAYVDLVAAGIEVQVERYEPPMEVDNEFFMVECSAVSEHDDLPKSLSSVPRSASSMLRTASKINTTWYVVWQVAFPTHVLASQYLSGTDYSLEMLCSWLEIDPALMKFAVSRGIREDIDPRVRELMSTKNPHRKRHKKKGEKRRRKPTSDDYKPKKKQKEAAPKGPSARIPAQLLSEGEPRLVVPQNDWWPEGWKMRTYQRMSGASKGSTDEYWYTPEKKLKLRSGAEISRFCKCMDLCGGDEERAWAVYKGKVS